MQESVIPKTTTEFKQFNINLELNLLFTNLTAFI